MVMLTGKSLPWAIFFGTLLVYLLFPTKNYYWDGLSFALTIEKTASFDSSLIHPNHLIYNIVGWLVYNAMQGIGLEVRALSALQATNSLFSALSAVILFYILNQFLRSRYLASVLAFLLAFSATWWKFSTDANSYIPSVFFLLICFYLVIRSGRPSTIVMAGLSHAVAMCFHQLAIFFFPVALVAIFLQSPALSFKNRVSRLAIYSAVAFFVTISAFYIGFLLQTTRPDDLTTFARWLTSYSPEVGFVFNFRESLMFTIRGHLRLMFGGRFNFLAEVFGSFTIALSAILIAAMVGLAVRTFRVRRITVTASSKPALDLRNIVIICLTWTVIYLGFLFFWIPQNTFYRLFYLPPMIVLLGVILDRYRTPGVIRSRAALAVAIIVLLNFLFLIYPYAHVRQDTPLALAYQMNNHWSRQTTVYYSQEHSDRDLLAYFNPTSNWKKIETIDLVALESELSEIQSRGGNAWLETTASKKIQQIEGGAEWLARHGDPQSERALINSAYDMRLLKIVP